MVDFRKLFPALAVVAVVLGSASTASAQFTPALSCSSNTAGTPLVRAEGIAELVGDIVLNCTGGIPTAAGLTVPQVNIQVSLNTNITSRLVADPFSEALILIDDPAPNQQVPCLASNCPVLGVFTGSANFNGVNFKSSGVPNVYQARSAAIGTSAIQWLGVPIDPPGSNAFRTIRITNVRANASQLGTSSTLIPTQIQMFISITPQQALPLNNPQQTVAYVQPGLNFSVRTANNSGTTGGITFLQCVSNNADISADNTKALNTASSVGLNGVSFLARFSETFPSSFKRRNVAPLSSTGSGSGFSADVSPTPNNQDSPGGLCPACVGGQYFTETGFYAGATGGSLVTSTNGLNRAGLADHGTRLMLRFAGVPAGTLIFVGAYETPAGVPLASNTTSRVRLVSTDANGAGAFSATSVTSSGLYAPVPLTGGAGVAVYEVMNSDPLSAENIDVPVVVAFTSNTSTNNPGLGTGTITGSFAPLSTVLTQSSSAPLPRFADVPKTNTALTINACSTNLLFPFVTNQAGFDSGIAIANTSLDPFGTKTQQGACVINYYGNTTGGGAAPAAATSPVVKAGDELIFLLSSGGGGVAATPGFQGYIIAQCAFQYAHGFAFISDLGSQKLAEGYLALVMDTTAPTIPRSKVQSEPLGQ